MLGARSRLQLERGRRKRSLRRYRVAIVVFRQRHAQDEYVVSVDAGRVGALEMELPHHGVLHWQLRGGEGSTRAARRVGGERSEHAFDFEMARVMATARSL